MRCDCGKEMHPKTVEQKVQVGDDVFTGTVEAMTCACGEKEIPMSELRRLEKAVAAHIAENGPVSKETFKFMRKAIALPSVELAKLLGVAAESISRWEGGARELDRSAWMNLGSLVLDDVEGRTTTRARMLRVDARPNGIVKVPGREKVLPTLIRALELVCGAHLFEESIAEGLGVPAEQLRVALQRVEKLGFLTRITIPATGKKHVDWQPTVPGGFHGLLDALIAKGVNVYERLDESQRTT